MKKILFVSVLCLVLALVTSCLTLTAALASTQTSTPHNRDIVIDGTTVNEEDDGGCERWYATNYFSSDDQTVKYFQVGYFKNSETGFVLYGDGTTGTEAYFYREGLDLRWDWGTNYRDGNSYFRYSFIIEPDGTGLYYDFSTSTDGTAKPSDLYTCKKF